MSEAVSSARIAARSLLSAVLIQGRALDQAWSRALQPKGWLADLSPRDRAFARLLTVTVLRRLGEIDAVLDRYLAHPPPAHLRNILRLGVAQLRHLGTPAHAGVDATVALAGANQRQRALANAVLRRVASGNSENLDGDKAARLNTPGWLWQSWLAAYGESAAKQIAMAHLEEPPLDLTLKRPEEAALWVERLNATVLPQGSLRLRAAGVIEELAGYAEGAWWVQDAAAAMPARLFGDVHGRRIADLCAAPGGKAAQLIAMGARITALDKSRQRLDIVKSNLERLKLEAELIVADATQWKRDADFDGVLLDAPCSATGTIRRHPDIAHLKSPKDVASAAVLQAQLLAAAWRLLRPGGYLIYCTCSLQPEENEAQIASLLAGGAPLERVAIKADEIATPPDAVTALGDLRTLPRHWRDMGGMDGFYACRLRRL
jgi:16S rRNA (cytosine967-C5)-methyltransferase